VPSSASCPRRSSSTTSSPDVRGRMQRPLRESEDAAAARHEALLTDFLSWAKVQSATTPPATRRRRARAHPGPLISPLPRRAAPAAAAAACQPLPPRRSRQGLPPPLLPPAPRRMRLPLPRPPTQLPPQPPGAPALACVLLHVRDATEQPHDSAPAASASSVSLAASSTLAHALFTRAFRRRHPQPAASPSAIDS
jgi:hypothetical protein